MARVCNSCPVNIASIFNLIKSKTDIGFKLVLFVLNKARVANSRYAEPKVEQDNLNTIVANLLLFIILNSPFSIFH
ncbi:MAG: hypothetical protein PF541_14770, partial [Prolixibacteraceae bacterium]|nr:hypothetical protein [Prolixibacteraceae bacterium]